MSFQVKLLRKLTRRPYGLAKFRVGRTFYSKVVRFDKDSVEWFGGRYFFNKTEIVIERGAGGKKTYDVREWSNFEEGFPVIYFDVNSAVPMQFTNVHQDSPSAKRIQANIKKEIAAAEAELLRKSAGKLQQFVMACMILSAVALIASGWAVIKLDHITPIIEGLPPAIDSIRLLLATP